MKRSIVTMLALCATCGAGAASAKQMPRFIDADHRTTMIVPVMQGDLLTAEAAGADPMLEAVLSGSEPDSPSSGSPKLPAQVEAHIGLVPEPSGLVMLIGGLLLLLAASSQGRSAVFNFTNRKLPALPLKLK
jgi:hypothetical protein